MSRGGAGRRTGRDVRVSLLYALGLWGVLALAMAAIVPLLPSGDDSLNWPMIVSAAISALYVIACWQFVPSTLWFVAGLAIWTLVALLLIAVAPVEWLEPIFGRPAP